MTPNNQQLELFPQNSMSNTSLRYQIKRFDDDEFRITIETSKDNEDLESLALEKLGYFILPEIGLNDE